MSLNSAGQMELTSRKFKDDHLPVLSVGTEYESWRRTVDMFLVADGMPRFNDLKGKDIMRKNAYNPSGKDAKTRAMIATMIDEFEQHGTTLDEDEMIERVNKVLLDWSMAECGVEDGAASMSSAAPSTSGPVTRRSAGLRTTTQTTGTGQNAVTSSKIVLSFVGDDASVDDKFVMDAWLQLCYVRALDETGDSFVRRVTPSALLMYKMVMKSLSTHIKDKLVAIVIGDLPAIRPELQLILEREELFTPLKLFQKFLKATMAIEGKGDLMTYLAHMTTVRQRLKAANYQMTEGQDCEALVDGLDKVTCKAFITLELMRDSPEKSWDKVVGRLQRWAASDYGRIDLKSGGKMRGYALKSEDLKLTEEESELDKLNKKFDELSKILLLKVAKKGRVSGFSGMSPNVGSTRNSKLFEECRQQKVCFDHMNTAKCTRGSACRFAHSWPKEYQVIHMDVGGPGGAKITNSLDQNGTKLNYMCTDVNQLFTIRARGDDGSSGGLRDECTSATMCVLKDPEVAAEIILDNGANRCITSLIQCAYNVEACNVVVESASKERFTVTRKCSMDFRVRETGSIITMTGVLLYNDCPVELMSVSQILAKGGYMRQTASGAIIASENGDTILTATSRNGLLIANVDAVERTNDVPDMTVPQAGSKNHEDGSVFASRSAENLAVMPRGHDAVRRVVLEHLSMAHLNYQAAATSIGIALPVNMPPCWACAMAKPRKEAHDSISCHKATRVGEIFYMDFFGPYQIPTLEGYIYDWLIVDAYSGKVKGFSLKDLSMEVVFPLWEQFHAQHEAKFNGTKKVSAVIHDNTLSFNNRLFIEHALKHGYSRTNNAPFEQWMNQAERVGGIINEAVRANLIQSGLPASTRDWSLQNAISARNNSRKSPRSAENLPAECKSWTRNELYNGKKLAVSESRKNHPFGSLVVVPIPLSFIRNDAGPKAWPALFLVYAEEARSYIVYVPSEKKFIQSFQIRNFPLVFPLRSKSPIPLDAVPYEREDETNVLSQAESGQESALLQDMSSAIKVRKSHGNDVFDLEPDEERPARAERVPPEQISDHVNPHISRRRGWNPSAKALERLQQDLNHADLLNAKSKEITLTPDEVVTITPTSTTAALRGPMGDKWEESVKKAYRLLKEYAAFGEAQDEHPGRGVRVVGTGNIHKIKCSGPVKLSELESKAFKTRTVVFGNNQDESTYDEVSADVVRSESVRIVAALATRLGVRLWAADIESAYFNSLMDFILWVRLPPGYDPESDEIRDLKAPPLYAKLLKGVPGIRQGAKLFYGTFKVILAKHGFNPIPADPCVFISKDFFNVIVLIHVDDILAMASEDQARAIFGLLRKDLKIPEYGLVKRFLGIDFEVCFGEDARFIHLSQPAMADTIVERAGLLGCSPRGVASSPGNKYSKEDSPANVEEVRKLAEEGYSKDEFRSIVAACNWMAMCTRPKLKFPVGKLAKFMNNPGRVHFKQLNAMVRFIAGTRDHGITFRWSSQTKPSGVVTYYDASHNDCPDSMKSTIASVITMDGAPISWYSKLSTMVARATQHSELFAAELALTDTLWVRMLLNDLIGIVPEEEVSRPTPFGGDNKGLTLCLTGSVNHATNKHVKQKIYLVRQEVPHSIAPCWIPKLENPADGFTKPGVVQQAYDTLECKSPVNEDRVSRQSGGPVANLTKQ